jgi:hypothetical protein
MASDSRTRAPQCSRQGTSPVLRGPVGCERSRRIQVQDAQQQASIGQDQVNQAGQGSSAASGSTSAGSSASRRLRIGTGYLDNVSPEVGRYKVSSKQVLTHWFSYRPGDRSRPLIGDRRPPSPLGDVPFPRLMRLIQPDRLRLGGLPAWVLRLLVHRPVPFIFSTR